MGNATIDIYGVDWDEDKYVLIYSSVNLLDPYYYLIEINNNGGYVNGTISVYVDGILKLTKDVHTVDELIFVDVTVDDLDLYNNIAFGNHTVKVVYIKDNGKRHEIEKSVDFYAEPIFDKNFVVSVGERDVLKIIYIKGFNGTATLYNTVEEQFEYNTECSYLAKGSL